MRKRRTTRSRDRWQAIARLLLIVVLALVALYVWRSIEAPSSRLSPAVRQAATNDHAGPPPASGEEFSDAERQGLEEILRRHGAGKSKSR